MVPHIHIGIFVFSSYSLMLALGFFVLMTTLLLQCDKREKLLRRETNCIALLTMVGFAVLGFFALLMNSLFHSIKEKRIVVGGITWLGGVVWTFPLLFLALKKILHVSWGEVLDRFNLIVAPIALGHGIGRVGCFLGGCCYGKVSNSIFAVRFPAGSNAAILYPSVDGKSQPVLPTQLFEAMFEACMALFLFLSYQKTRRHQASIYCICYGIFRFMLEFLRGDDRGATGILLTPSQIMSILMILYGIGLEILEKKTRNFQKST